MENRIGLNSDIDTYLKLLNYLISKLNILRDKIVLFEDSNEKEELNRKLYLRINSLNIFKNNYDNYILEQESEFECNDVYITANYPLFDEDGNQLHDSLSVIGLSQNLKCLYLCDELWPIFSDEDYSDIDDEYRIGYQEMFLYYIDYDNKIIKMVKEEGKVPTINMYNNALRNMNYLIKKLKKI